MSPLRRVTTLERPPVTAQRMRSLLEKPRRVIVCKQPLGCHSENRWPRALLSRLPLRAPKKLFFHRASDRPSRPTFKKRQLGLLVQSRISNLRPFRTSVISRFFIYLFISLIFTLSPILINAPALQFGVSCLALPLNFDSNVTFKSFFFFFSSACAYSSSGARIDSKPGPAASLAPSRFPPVGSSACHLAPPARGALVRQLLQSAAAHSLIKRASICTPARCMTPKTRGPILIKWLPGDIPDDRLPSLPFFFFFHLPFIR